MFLIQVDREGHHLLCHPWDTYSPLLVMSRNTAVVLKKCLLTLGGPTFAANGFKQTLRCVVTDHAPSNVAAEQSLKVDRVWSLLHIFCDLHSISSCHGKTFESLLGHHVTGFIRVALTFRQGTMMQVLRQAVAEIVKVRLEVSVCCSLFTARLIQLYCML